MSSTVQYICNGCGKAITPTQAAEFAGIWSGQSTVASGGAHDWHACNGTCAAKHLREVASAIEARGQKLDAERAAHTAAVAAVKGT